MRCLKISKLLAALLLLPALGLYSGCAPVFSEIQSAKLVGKGEFEVTPSITSVSFSNGGETGHIQDHVGIQAGYGLGETVDMRLRYERISVDSSGSNGFNINVLGFGPKFSVIKDRTALYLPVLFAYGDDISDASDTWAAHPTLIFTRQASESFEWNSSVKALVPLRGNESDLLVAFNLGAGISSNFSEWVFRPELGFLYNPGNDGFYTQFSLGMTLYP